MLRLYAQPALDDGRILALEAAERILERMARYPDYRLYVVTRDDRVVGTFALLIMDNLAHLGTPSAVIEDVAVAPDWQRRGVGRAMMRHALGWPATGAATRRCCPARPSGRRPTRSTRPWGSVATASATGSTWSRTASCPAEGRRAKGPAKDARSPPPGWLPVGAARAGSVPRPDRLAAAPPSLEALLVEIEDAGVAPGAAALLGIGLGRRWRQRDVVRRVGSGHSTTIGYPRRTAQAPGAISYACGNQGTTPPTRAAAMTPRTPTILSAVLLLLCAGAAPATAAEELELLLRGEAGSAGTGGTAVEPARQQARAAMVREQLESRGIDDAAVLRAMTRVPRHAFVPEALAHRAYADSPLPIGHGQTISQPYIVGYMTEILELEPEDRVLEVGTGSGYQAAVLAELVRSVVSIEIVRPLAVQAGRRLERLGYRNVTVLHGDGYYGRSASAPYDAIVVTAAASHVPPPLIEQLEPGGRMAIPVGRSAWTQNLLLVEKQPDGAISTRNLLPVRFVPLTGEH